MLIDTRANSSAENNKQCSFSEEIMQISEQADEKCTKVIVKISHLLAARS